MSWAVNIENIPATDEFDQVADLSTFKSTPVPHADTQQPRLDNVSCDIETTEKYGRGSIRDEG